MTKITIYSIFFGLSSVLLYGQEPLSIINSGELSVSPGDLVSFEGNFENTDSGDMTNDGTVIYYYDFENNGTYGITTNNQTSTTLFTVEGLPTTAKKITGNGISSFYNIEFNSPLSNVAFDLKNNIDAWGVVDFENGIVLVDSVYNPATEVSYGMFTFNQGSKAQNMRNEAHVDGVVEKVGTNTFTYPFGDKGVYRPAHIAAAQNEKDIYVGRYIYNDKSFFKERTHKVGVIETINTNEYWIIEKGNKDKESNIVLTLGWDELTTSEDVLNTPEEDLHIVRWDDQQKIWVDEGGVVDMSKNEVTTIGTVKGYGIFTFGTVKKDWLLDGDIVIYNLVTPDGDGKNEYFVIDHIKNYPNKVEIFNRWGTRVYETTNYDPYGDGSTNVFRGYSEGKATVDKGSKLPSGTYYYVITYEYTDANGSRMIKKAANLHLETN